MIKRVPIIDINTGEVIRNWKHKKRHPLITPIAYEYFAVNELLEMGLKPKEINKLVYVRENPEEFLTIDDVREFVGVNLDAALIRDTFLEDVWSVND